MEGWRRRREKGLDEGGMNEGKDGEGEGRKEKRGGREERMNG